MRRLIGLVLMAASFGITHHLAAGHRSAHPFTSQYDVLIPDGLYHAGLGVGVVLCLAFVVGGVMLFG